MSIAGVAFSVLLIMILQGLYQGWSNKIGEYIRTIDTDFWVTQGGSEDMFHTHSVLSATIRGNLEQVNGVASAKPFRGRRVAYMFNDEDVNMYLVSSDAENDTGKPGKIVKGKSLPEPGEIIVDRVAANIKHIKIGDTLPIPTKPLKVAGFSEGGDVVTFSFAFINQVDAEEIFKTPGSVNYFLVTVSAGEDKNAAAQSITSQFPNLSVFTKQEFVANNTKIISDTFLPVILALLVIGVIVGIAVIALTIFTSTLEKAKEYGVLKAIGISSGKLYLVVVEQALLSGLIGFVIGGVLTYLAQAILSERIPQFATEITAFDVGWIFALTLLMSIIAAYIPIRRINKIDPAEVFKA